MRAFHVGLFVCSFISVSAVASKCFVENDEPSFLQSSAPNRTVTLAAVPPLNNETQQPEVAKPLRGRKIGNQKKTAKEKPKQVPAAGNASASDEDDDLFPPDDPHAPGPWQDICAISGSTFFATMLLCFVWCGSLWSVFGSEMDSDGTGLSRIGWNFGKLSLCILLQVLVLLRFGARDSAMVQCGLCLVSTCAGFAQRHFFGLKDPAKSNRVLQWLIPSELTGGLIFMSLELATLLSLTQNSVESGQAAFGLALLGEVLVIMVTAVISEGSEVNIMTWASLSGHVLLPFPLTQVMSKLLKAPLHSCEVRSVMSLRYSHAAAYSVFFFLWIMWACYWTNPGAFWRPCFMGIVLLLLTPGLSHTTGEDVLYGPWAMFGGGHEGWAPSFAGKIMISIGALLVVIAIILARNGSTEIMTFQWQRRGPDATLSLVRILLPFWLFAHVNWGGDDSPISKWFAPPLVPGGDTPLPRIMMRLFMILLALGIWGPFCAMIAAAGFAMACSRNSYDPDCPTQHIALLLVILSFTPCDACYSVSSYLRKQMPSSTRYLGDGGDHLWAKSLFRLQCSLLYFFAAEYKMQPDWLGPRGGSLIKEIHIFDLSNLSDFEHAVLRTRHMREIVAHLIAISIIAVETSLAFGFWSTRYHAFFLGAAAAMHLGMVMLCGQIGGFSQAGWTGLLCIGHEKLEEILQDPKNFAIVALSCVTIYSFIGGMFEFDLPGA